MTELTRDQVLAASKMVDELAGLRETMPSAKGDPDGHLLQWWEIMDTTAKLEKLLPATD